MKMQCKHFQWSDNWWIEGNRAWFVGGDVNLLFELDMDAGQCKVLAELPISTHRTHRVNPYCIKCDDKIFCMPCYGESIWIYHLSDCFFSEIKLGNWKTTKPLIASFWREGVQIYALVGGSGKIIVIDTEKEMLEECYSLTNKEGDFFSRGIRVENYIYVNSRNNNCVYEFNMISKKIKKYILQTIKGGFGTINYDGKNFWLSGYKKEFYIWDKETDNIRIITQLPKEFGIYNWDGVEGTLIDYKKEVSRIPLFVGSVCGKRNMWFFPMKTNKILYADYESKEIRTFEIEREEENLNSLKSTLLSQKYLIMYVRADRYIGVFSLKNECYFEIDMEEKKICDINFCMDIVDLKKIYSSIHSFDEQSKFHRYLYDQFLGNGRDIAVAHRDISVGEQIYREVINENLL